MSKAKILLWDIESTDLDASFGHALCIGYKWLGGRTKVVALDDVKKPGANEEPDAELWRHFHPILSDQADIIVTFYGKGFDRKFANTRMLLAGLPPLPPLNSEHIDLYFTARGNLKLHSNRLQAVAETLGCPIDKTPIRADAWRRANRGDPKAIKYVIEHCKRDVDILEWVYEKLKPFVRQHPPVGGRSACRVCGGTAFQQRGNAISMSPIPKVRVVCKSCGRWDTRNKEAA